MSQIDTLTFFILGSINYIMCYDIDYSEIEAYFEKLKQKQTKLEKPIEVRVK